MSMLYLSSFRSTFALFAVFCAVGVIACTEARAGSNSNSSNSGKIPITTKSDEAKTNFLRGQDLFDKLQANASRSYFDKAIELDPAFASAELARANSSPTAAEFFEHQKKAMDLAGKTSEGERLLIWATNAGSNGEVVKQKEYLEKATALYPNDERAQFALANYYFGQQDLNSAVDHYKKATSIAPNFTPAYNVLGYAYRQKGDFTNAEEAFKKYIELLPSDPNPYDSYAELLLKMGRFDDSVTQYNKALGIDTHFNASRFGISADLTYMGKAGEARTVLQQMADMSRNDGELRTAYFGMAVVDSDSGDYSRALKDMDMEYAVAEKKNDLASMSADLQAKGNILAEIPKYDDAKSQFDRSLQLIESADVSQEIKDNAKLLHHFNMCALAIGMKDYSAASGHAEEYRKGAEAGKNPAQIKLAHELAGRIALAQKNYSKAIDELQKANAQDPRNLYRLGEAYAATGDSTKARNYYSQAAKFNPLPQLPFAFIRSKAQKAANES
jgi:tetratricopeptide (TPR) repeat protein